MPNYELICNGCGHRFSILGSYKDKEAATCPACGSADLRQQYGLLGFKSGSGSGSSSTPPRSFG